MGYQISVHEPLADHRGDDMLHLPDRIHLADVVTARELVHVALQVLRAQLVERALVSPLQKLSTPFVCAWPLTYSATECLTASRFSRPSYALASSV